MDLRKRVLLFYGIALLCLLATIPLSLLYGTIMQMTAVGIAFFIGFMLIFSFASAYARLIADIYQKDNIGSVYRYAGTINPSSFGIVAGIISFLVVAVSFAGIVDWEYLGLTMPNIFTVFWAVTGICALIGGIMARPLAKRKFTPPSTR
ncbi:hypothetical protein E4H12_07775 [Candidatus Thorarchaeota archaeon]|nr:MAG: hypothetical protein E4H12_07775 [Candidatus Thorarchaeota archaeon]